MVNYRQTNLAVHVFRGFTSRIRNRPEPISRSYFTKPSSLASKPVTFPGFYPSCSVLLNNPIPQTHLQFRSYHVESVVEWFPIEWFWVTPVSLWVGSKVVWFVLSRVGTFETVPFTNRWQLVLWPRRVDRQLGENQFKGFLKHGPTKGAVLPVDHPESERVHLIAGNIFDVLRRGSVSHFVDLNWEVFVLNVLYPHIACSPSGKVVVFTGLSQSLGSDAELAVLIARQVACIVARHHSQTFREMLSVPFQVVFQLILYQFVSFGVLPYFAAVFSAYLMILPSLRRIQLEADHIGLILMASAGYDPRVALTVYENNAKISGGGSALSDYIGSHPSLKKRREILTENNIMEEALTIYRQVRGRPSS